MAERHKTTRRDFLERQERRRGAGRRADRIRRRRCRRPRPRRRAAGIAFAFGQPRGDGLPVRDCVRRGDVSRCDRMPRSRRWTWSTALEDQLTVYRDTSEVHADQSAGCRRSRRRRRRSVSAAEASRGPVRGHRRRVRHHGRPAEQGLGLLSPAGADAVGRQTSPKRWPPSAAGICSSTTRRAACGSRSPAWS